MDPHNRAVIGYKVGKNNPLGEAMPLTTSGSQAPLHLDFLHTLDLDNSGEFLTTDRSTYTLRADDAATPIITYDFVREPPNSYPEAHIHVHGQSDALQRMLDSCGLVDRKPAEGDPFVSPGLKSGTHLRSAGGRCGGARVGGGGRGPGGGWCFGGPW